MPILRSRFSLFTCNFLLSIFKNWHLRMLITQRMLLMSCVGFMVVQHERGLGKECIYYNKALPAFIKYSEWSFSLSSCMINISSGLRQHLNLLLHSLNLLFQLLLPEAHVLVPLLQSVFCILNHELSKKLVEITRFNRLSKLEQETVSIANHTRLWSSKLWSLTRICEMWYCHGNHTVHHVTRSFSPL